MRFPLATKLFALVALLVLLTAALESVDGLAAERRARQLEAEVSVAASLADRQAVLGPVLQRRCTEIWTRVEGTGKEQRSVARRREFVQTGWPLALAVEGTAQHAARHRGIFQVNTFLARVTMQTEFAALSAPVAENTGGTIACGDASLEVAVTDARGIRNATVEVDGRGVAVEPGSTLPARARGFHAPGVGRGSAPLKVQVQLELAGTGTLAFAPVGDRNAVRLASNWPHPSFGGRFLPVQRTLRDDGFDATWQVSSLATTAQQALAGGAALCELHPGGGTLPAAAPHTRECVEVFGVGFVEPVNTYALADRAIKYGLLFIVLTFVAVALVEVLRRLRVHPVQYLLVGCALTVFFLLLLSLSEHLPFGTAYLAAASACTALLAFYARHVLHGWRAGAWFGAGIAMLYGALYALLQLEQTALVIGSLMVFAALAAVMVATRRVDWYALALQLRAQADATRPAAAAAAAA
jgi:inner membrane protein